MRHSRPSGCTQQAVRSIYDHGKCNKTSEHERASRGPWPVVGVAAQSPTGRCSHQMEPERASATCAGPGASTSVAASAPPHGASMPTLSVFEAQKLLHLAAVAKQLGLLSGECSANGNAAGKTVRKGVVSPACDPQAPTFDDIPDTMAVAAEVVPARQPLNPLVPAALRWPLISRWWPCTSSAAGEC